MAEKKIRPLAPLGVLGIGTPPVSIYAVARLAMRAPGDEVARVRAVHRDLGEGDVNLALAEWRRDPAACTPRPDAPTLLRLALPVGFGTLVSVLSLGSFAALLVLILRLAFPPPGAVPESELGIQASVGGLSVAAFAFLLALVAGVLAAKLVPAGRWALAAVAAAAFLALVLTPSDERSTLRITLGLVALGCAGVFFPGVKAWFEPDGRAAAGALALEPYVVAVGSLSIVYVAVILAALFQDSLTGTSVALGPTARLVLGVASAVRGFEVACWPFLIALGPMPLLRLPAGRERLVSVVAVAIAVLALGVVSVSVVGPVLELQRGPR